MRKVICTLVLLVAAMAAAPAAGLARDVEIPEQARLWHERGLYFIKVGQLDDAVAAFDRAIGAAPEFSDPWFGRGLARFRQKDYDAAVRDLSRAIELNPENLQARYYRSIIWTFKDQHEKVIEELTPLIEKTPGFYAGYINRGHAHMELHDYRSALADFREALSVEPDHATALYATGTAHEALGNADKALEYYDRAVEQDASRSRYFLDRAALLARTGQLGKAAASYLSLALQAPENASVRARLADVRRMQGQADEAMSVLEEALAVSPDHRDALYVKARVRAEQGDYLPASRDLYGVIAHTPRKWVWLLAEHYRMKGARQPGAEDLPRPDEPAFVLDLDHTADGRYVMAAFFEPEVRLYDASSLFPVDTLYSASEGQAAPKLTAAALSPDGCVIGVAGLFADSAPRVLNLCGDNAPNPLVGHESLVYDIRFSGDGERLITAGLDNTVRIWDTATGVELLRLEGHRDAVIAAAVSPNGDRAVSASADGTARLWNLATGQTARVLYGHKGPVLDCAFTPDGKHVLTAGEDGVVRVYEARDGGFVRVAMAGDGRAAGFALFPDGRRALSPTAGVFGVLEPVDSPEVEVPDGTLEVSVSTRAGLAAVAGSGPDSLAVLRMTGVPESAR
ncbi:MAG: tetratricopeptide repeat protein [Desulfatibacillaceae bacterium]